MSFAVRVFGRDLSTAPGSVTLVRQGVVMGGPTPVTVRRSRCMRRGLGDGTKAIPLGTQLPTDGIGALSLSGTYHCPDHRPWYTWWPRAPRLRMCSTNPNLSLMVVLGTCGSLTKTTQVRSARFRAVHVLDDWDIYGNDDGGDSDAADVQSVALTTDN